MTDNQGNPVSVLAVTLCPPDGQNSTSFTDSLMRLFAHDATTTGSLIRGGGPMLLPASPNTIPDRRNQAAAYLLDESSADWLLFIDSDMGFSENALEMLLDAADPVGAPVIGALCFGLRQVEADGVGGFHTQPFPTLYDWTENKETRKWGFSLRYDYSADVVTQVAATGAAFLLIHRSALQVMREQMGDVWFDRARMEAGEGLMGEDIAFCARLGRLGIPLFVHTGVRTTHLKSVWVDEEFYLGQRTLAMMRADVSRETEAVQE